MAEFKCKHCGHTTAIYEQVGPHVGERCASCGKWIRWVPKKECVKTNISPVKSSVETQLLKDELHHYDIENEEAPW